MKLTAERKSATAEFVYRIVMLVAGVQIVGKLWPNLSDGNLLFLAIWYLLYLWADENRIIKVGEKPPHNSQKL